MRPTKAWCCFIQRHTHPCFCFECFCRLVQAERHGQSAERGIGLHYAQSESDYHGCMLLVFRNDCTHSFCWRGMDVSPVEASILISQSHVRFFSWGNPAEWVQMRTLTVEAVSESFFPCFQKHSHGSLLLLCVVLDKGIDSI